MPRRCNGATTPQVDRELPAGTNVQDGARLDISASGVWGGRFERTFFDVRVFNPLAASPLRTSHLYTESTRAKKEKHMKLE